MDMKQIERHNASVKNDAKAIRRLGVVFGGMMGLMTGMYITENTKKTHWPTLIGGLVIGGLVGNKLAEVKERNYIY